MCENCEIMKADLIPLVKAIQGDFSLCKGRESLQALDGTEEFPVLAGLLAARLAQTVLHGIAARPREAP